MILSFFVSIWQTEGMVWVLIPTLLGVFEFPPLRYLNFSVFLRSSTPITLYTTVKTPCTFWMFEKPTISSQQPTVKIFQINNVFRTTYEGETILVSFKLVLACFWMVSSCPSNELKYCMCWGEGTGIRLGSLQCELADCSDWVCGSWGCCFCCDCRASDCSDLQNIPSGTENE